MENSLVKLEDLFAVEELAKEYPGFTFVFTDVAELDITVENDIDMFVRGDHPAVIINCAAYTAVDKAEQEDSLAFLISAACQP